MPVHSLKSFFKDVRLVHDHNCVCKQSAFDEYWQCDIYDAPVPFTSATVTRCVAIQLLETVSFGILSNGFFRGQM